MSILDYFKPVSTWSGAEVRKFLNQRRAGEYNLVDVRQSEEYEQGHLPGAQLIPVGELPNQLAKLDPTKPTIVY
jgi:rhodanese-related sulfurtransferase